MIRVPLPPKRPAAPTADKYLLLIDTNIWLDFYRMEASQGVGDALKLLTHARSRIVSTDQILMEFMKHRQNIILQMLDKFKPPEAMNLPPILADKKAAQAMHAQRKAMGDRRRKLREHVEKILHSPATHDPVFRNILSLFTDPTELVLCRPNPARYTIRRLAGKRWLLGYPPRKESDLSISDAINWEWGIHCASRRGGHLIIVSRDSDYGRPHNGQVYVNDWLQREYRERVKGRGKLVLTNQQPE